MKQVWKLIIVSLTSILWVILPVKMANSCGFSPSGEDTRISFFNPYLSGNSELAAFYYDLNHYLSDYEYVDIEPDYIRNCEEWQGQFEDSVSVSDIYDILYKTSIDTMINAFEDSTWQVLYQENTFVNALSKDEHQDKLDYFKLIIQLEFSHFADVDPWGLDDRLDYYDRKEVWKKTANEIETISFDISPFLQERYAYQLVVLYYYLQNSNKCIAAFDNNLKNSSSILKSWGSIYKGSALYWQGKKAKANLALANSFYGCESKKIRIVQLMDKEYLDSSLVLAKTKEEKVALYTFKSINYTGPALDDLQKIVKLEPTYDFLPMLIQREIHKLENWLLTPYLSGELTDMDYNWLEKEEYRSYKNDFKEVNFAIQNNHYTHKNYQKDVEHLRQLRGLLIQLVPKRKDKDFLNLAIAQLYFLDFKPSIAKSYTSKVNINTSDEIKSQVYIQRILETAQTQNVNSKAVQAQFADMLIWLCEHKSILENADRTLSQLNLYLSRVFHKNGNIPIAGLLYAMTDHTQKAGGGFVGGNYSNILLFDKYASLTDVDVALQILDKKSKTKFEEYLIYSEPIWDSDVHKDYYFYEKGEIHERIRRRTDIPKVSKIAPQKFQVLADTFAQDFKHMLLDVKGTIAFRQDKLNIAYESWAKSNFDYRGGSSYYYYENDNNKVKNPFNDRWINLATDQKNKTKHYKSKEAVVERLINLKKSSSPDSLYLLGKAYHSFTYWGKAWKMFNYGKYPYEWKPSNRIGSYENYSFYPNSEKYENEYYKLSRATKYFEKAFNHPKASFDLKARALYMLSECDRRHNDWLHLKSENSVQKKYVSPYTKQLERDFKKSNLYYYYINCSHGS